MVPPGAGAEAAETRTRNHLAALDVDSHALLPWDPDADGPVRAMALSADRTKLYVGGDFGHIGGTPAPFLSLVDLSTGRSTRASAPACWAASEPWPWPATGSTWADTSPASAGPPVSSPDPSWLPLDALTGELLPWAPPALGPGRYVGHTGIPTPTESSGDVLSIAVPTDGSRVLRRRHLHRLRRPGRAAGPRRRHRPAPPGAVGPPAAGVQPGRVTGRRADGLRLRRRARRPGVRLLADHARPAAVVVAGRRRCSRRRGLGDHRLPDGPLRLRRPGAGPAAPPGRLRRQHRRGRRLEPGGQHRHRGLRRRRRRRPCLRRRRVHDGSTAGLNPASPSSPRRPRRRARRLRRLRRAADAGHHVAHRHSVEKHLHAEAEVHTGTVALATNSSRPSRSGATHRRTYSISSGVALAGEPVPIGGRGSYWKASSAAAASGPIPGYERSRSPSRPPSRRAGWLRRRRSVGP